jgi:hypothetical protein
MNKHLQDQLFTKYPKIFRQKDLSVSETCMCWGITLGDGWYDLLDVLCSNIQEYLDWINGEGEFEGNSQFITEDYEKVPQVEATQVKERYGSLNFYCIGGDEYTEGLISMAESLSARVCEYCGAPGTRSERGWIHTLCAACRVGRSPQPEQAVENE